MADKIKLVAFDFEGTLAINISAKSTWEALARELNYLEEREQIRAAYRKGELTYAQWMLAIANLLKERGLTRAKLEQIVRDDLVPMPGAIDLLTELMNRKVKTAIISGGIKNVFEIFAEQHGIRADHVSMANNLVFDENGKMLSAKSSNLDFEGKVTVLGEICGKEGIPLSEVAYVGNDINDIHAFREVGLPIAINSESEELKAAAKVVIGQRDLSLVLNYI